MLSFDELIASKFENVVRTRDDMHDYQRTAHRFMMDNPFSALFIDLGMGKSITSLSVIVDILSSFECEKVLVVGPLRVATCTWPDEIALWEHTAGFNHIVLRENDDDPRLAAARAAGRAQARQQGLGPSEVTKAGQEAEQTERERIRVELAHHRASIHIINKERLAWLVELHGKNWPYRTVIVDESSMFKSHKTEVFKALAKVRNTPGLIRRLHLLTATPATETYASLFPQTFLLDGGERFGKGITRFMETYFTYNKYSMKWKLRPGAEEEILAKIADICLVMKAEDYLDIEKPVFVPRKVHLTDKQMGLYRQMERDFVVTLPNGVEIEAETAAALSQKLLQMASGVLYETYFDEDLDTEDMKKVKRVHHLHDHKIEMLRQIVEESQGAPLLVSYHFKSSLDRLKKAFPKATVMDRDGKCVKPWNAGKIPMLLIHPQSGGHGLNMQHGGHNLVFFDLPWSLELYQQLIGRLARQGQKHVVVVQLLLAAGTLDEFVYASLQEKADCQERLFVMLKRMIRAYRKRLSSG